MMDDVIHPFASMRQRALDHLSGGVSPRRAATPALVTPPVEVRESDREFTIQAELPGIPKDRIEVHCDAEGVLTIRADQDEERHPADAERLYLTERRYGPMSRSFQLPAGVDVEHIHADYRNGVLTIHIPKHTVSGRKRIPIEGSEDTRDDPPYTTRDGMTAPKFGAAGSGGLEYEPLP